MDDLIKARFDELRADLLAKKLIKEPRYSSTGAPIWNLNYHYRPSSGNGTFTPNDFLWTMAALDVAGGWLPAPSTKHDLYRQMAENLILMTGYPVLEPDYDD